MFYKLFDNTNFKFYNKKAMNTFTNETCYHKLIKEYNQGKLGSKIIFNKHKQRMSQFVKDIDNFTVVLVNLGFNYGDTLTLFLPTCPQALVAFYACSKIGVIANIVHPLTPIEQLKENLKKTNSKGLMFYDILIKDHSSLESTNQIIIKCSVADYTFWRKPFYSLYARLKCKPYNKTLKYKQLLKENTTSKIELPKGSSLDVVVSMHSGGTSNIPKIVKLSNEAINNLSNNLYMMYTSYKTLENNQYTVVSLPIFHAFGLGVAIHSCLIFGYNVILMPKFDAKKINKFIKQYNVTLLAGVPIMFKKMMADPKFEGKHLKKLKDLWCGGDTVNENFVEQFDEKLKKWGSTARLMRGYGLTETCSVCTVNNQKEYRKNSCGKPLPNNIIEIWDDNENKLQANQIGEIVINTNSMMTGYEDNSGITTKNGINYIKSGDIGYIDSDGFVFVIDRKKRVIKISAVNVYPSEIEAVAMTNEKVKEACAVGYHYNEKTYIRLYITIQDKWKNLVKEPEISKELKELITNSLIKYAIPREIKIIDIMPITKLGKKDYKKLESL